MLQYILSHNHHIIINMDLFSEYLITWFSSIHMHPHNFSCGFSDISDNFCLTTIRLCNITFSSYTIYTYYCVMNNHFKTMLHTVAHMYGHVLATSHQEFIMTYIQYCQSDFLLSVFIIILEHTGGQAFHLPFIQVIVSFPLRKNPGLQPN